MSTSDVLNPAPAFAFKFAFASAHIAPPSSAKAAPPPKRHQDTLKESLLAGQPDQPAGAMAAALQPSVSHPEEKENKSMANCFNNLLSAQAAGLRTGHTPCVPTCRGACQLAAMS